MSGTSLEARVSEQPAAGTSRRPSPEPDLAPRRSVVAASAVAAAPGIRPFRVDVPEAALADLRRRIAPTNGPARIARAWDVLMTRLGYASYVAQGGDWGAVVVDQMGVQAPTGLLAIHTNMPGIFPADVDAAAFAGAPTPSGLSDDETVAYER